MKKTFFAVLCALAWSGVFGAAPMRASAEKERILVLSTFHLTHPWTKGVCDEITRRYVDCADARIVEFVVLDAVRDRENKFERKFTHFLPRLAAGEFKMIIALLDDAIELVQQHYAELPKDLPVVFVCGPAPSHEFRRRFPNVTGFYSDFCLDETARWGLSLYPGLKELIVVLDEKYLNRAFCRRFLRDFSNHKSCKVSVLSSDKYTTDQMLDYVGQASRDSLVIFAPWMHFSRDGYVSLEQIADRLAERLTRPYLILTDVLFGHGALGGKVATGTEIGKALIGMTDRILKGENVAEIPIVSAPMHFMVDMHVFKKEGLNTSLLPPRTIRINDTPSLFKRNSVTLTLIAVLICALAVALLRIIRMGVRFHTQRQREVKARTAEHLRILRLLDEQSATLRSIGDGLIVTGPDETVKRANEGASRILGIPATDMIERPFTDVFPIRQVVRTDGPQKSLIRKVIEGEVPDGVPESVELMTVDGRHVYVTVRTSIIRSKDEHVISAVSVFHDTTDAVRDHKALERAEAALKTAAELAHIDYCEVTGTVKKIVFRHVSGETHWPFENGVPVPDSQWIHPSDLSSFRTAWTSAMNGLAGTGRIVYRAVQNGNVRHYVMRLSRMPDKEVSGEPSYSCVIQDVTEISRRQQELSDNNVLMRTILDLMPSPIVLKDAGNGFRFVMISRRYAEILNRTPEKMIGVTDADLFTSEDAAFHRETDRRVIATGECVRIMETMRDRSGGAVVLQVLKSAIKMPSGRTYVLLVSTDVTELERSKRAAESSEQLLRTVVDALPIAVTLRNPAQSYRIVFCNRRQAELVGLPRQKIEGSTYMVNQAATHEQVERLRKRDEDVIETGKRIDCEEAIKGLDGASRVYQASRLPVILPDGQTWLLSCFTDITKIRDLSSSLETTVRRQKELLTSEQIYRECLQTVSAGKDYVGTVRKCLEIIGTHCGADRCGLNCKRTADKELDQCISWTRDSVPTGGLVWSRHQLSECVDVWSRLGKGECCRFDDMDENSEFSRSLRVHAGEAFDQKSMLICGVLDADGLYGTLSLTMTTKKHIFSKAEEDILLACSRQLSLLRIRTLQKRELEKSIYLRRMIADNIDIPIFLFDAKGRLLSANNAAADKLNLDRNRLAVEPCHLSVCGSSVTPASCPVRAILRTGRPSAMDRTCNGRDFHFEAKTILDSSGRVQYVLETALDMTTRNAVQRELTAAMREAEAGLTAKNNFISTMNHEIRTPLNAVIGFSELLMDGEAVPEKERLQYVKAINESGKALLSLVDDVLGVSDLDTAHQTLQFEKTDLAELMHSIIAISERTAQEKHLSLKLVLPSLLPPLMLDGPRLRHAVLNLLWNALKFTHVGTVTVTVMFDPANENTGRLSIDVADTGIGIPAASLPHIFEPFVQDEVVRSSRAYQGSGLGLAVTRKLIKMMHGDVTVSSCENVGSTFTIRMDDISYESPRPALSVTRTDTKIPRVLIVDDFPVNLKILQLMLKRQGVECVSAVSGEDALSLLDKNKFDVILTDIWMPDMNGVTLADTIRGRQLRDDCRIYAITADANWHGAKSKKLFDGIFYKPIKTDDLQMILNGAVRTEANHARD